MIRMEYFRQRSQSVLRMSKGIGKAGWLLCDRRNKYEHGTWKHNNGNTGDGREV
jgi:hypothetical protein